MSGLDKEDSPLAVVVDFLFSMVLLVVYRVEYLFTSLERFWY